MTQRSTVLTIGVALLLVGTLIGGFTLGGSATGQPTTPDDSGSESGGNTTTTDSDTDFKDPSQVADEHPSNYTDSDDVVEDSLFTPSSNNSTENASNESGRWSEGAEVKDDCSGDWWDPADYSCQARDEFFEVIYAAVLDMMQWAMEGTHALLFSTPAPKDDEGNPAIFENANNWPWKTIYEEWFPYARMAGGTVWVLMMLGLLATDTFLPASVQRDFKLRQLRHRMIIAFPLIVISPSIASLFLNFIDALVHLVRPSGALAAGTIQRFFTQLNSVGLAIVLSWFLESIIFLVMLVILLVRWALMLVFGAFFPILFPLALIDIGPIKYLTEPIRGMFTMFITFALMPVPMAMSVTVGTLIVQAYEETAINQAMWSEVLRPFTGPTGTNIAVAIPAIILLAFWTLAALMPFFTFFWKGRAIHGFVGGMLAGASLPDLNTDSESADNGSNDRSREWSSPSFSKDHAEHDILEGSPFQRSASDPSTFGGQLGEKQIAQPTPVGPGNRPVGALPSGTDTRSTSGWWGSIRSRVSSLFTSNNDVQSGHSSSDNSLYRDSPRGRTSDDILSPTAQQVAERGREVIEVEEHTDLPNATYTPGIIDQDGEFHALAETESPILKQELLKDYRKYVSDSRGDSDPVVVQESESETLYSFDQLMIRDPAYEATYQRVEKQFENLDDKERRRSSNE